MCFCHSPRKEESWVSKFRKIKGGDEYFIVISRKMSPFLVSINKGL